MPVLTRAEDFGLLTSGRAARRLRFVLSPAGRALATALRRSGARGAPPEPGDLVLVVTADLLNARRPARLAVLERQHLTALHEAIQEAFGWLDDHLYSFWLDGGFFSETLGVEFTTPVTPDEGPPTADLPIAELGLRVGQEIGYVFDFGDEWRVRLTVEQRADPEAAAEYPACARAPWLPASAVPAAR